jgi:H+/Cl- antiporter ClcA
VSATHEPRRFLVLVLTGVVVAPAWYWLRRRTAGERAELDDSLWEGDASLSLRRSLGTSVLSEVVVGAGASVGREAAPRVMGGVAGTLFARWLGLSPAQRRLLVACGGGAGFAAVYNVPFAGALFTAEVLVGSTALPVVLPALACASIATAVAWPFLSNQPTYVHLPNYAFSASLLVWSLVVGPLIGLFAVAYTRLIGWISFRSLSDRRSLAAMPAAFAVLALIGIAYPGLYGNGKDLAEGAFLGQDTLVLVLALVVLKPLVTALCLGGGASGGLFTPSLSTGALLGSFFGLLWLHLWPGTPVGAFALVGAAAMISAAMQAPLVGLVVVLELTHGGFALTVPMIGATVVATALSRHVDGYSIYTARLPARRVAAAED